MYIFIKIAATILLLSLISCGSDDVESSRVSNEIIVDGLSNDWSDLKINYNEDLDIAFGVANSDTSLFFMIRFKDERFARMMTMRGFTIWFDDLSEDDSNLGIRYRVPDMHLDRRKPGQKQKPENSSFVPKGAVFALVKDEDNSMDWSLSTFTQLKAAFELADGFYCLEYEIPLNTGDNLPFDFDISNAKEMEIGAVLEAMNRSTMGGQMDAGERQAGGGRGGGSMGGGKRGGGMRGGEGGGQMPDMSEKEFWITVKLVK